MGTNNHNKQEPQHYQLKWNNHHANLSCVFEQLLQTEAFTDVTIACDGTSLKCHKMVLAACSSYFQKLFTDNPCQHPIVVLKDVHYSVFHSLLDFMYKGEVNISQEDLPSLMKLAESLKIKGLVEESSPPPPLSPIPSKLGESAKSGSSWSSSEDSLNCRGGVPTSSSHQTSKSLSVVPHNSSCPPLGPKGFSVITATNGGGGNDERSPSRESGSSSSGAGSITGAEQVRLAKSGLLGALSIQHPILRNALGTGNGLTGVSDSGSISDSAEHIERTPSISIERNERLPSDVNIVKKEMSTSIDVPFTTHAVTQIKKEAGIPSLNPIRLASMPITVSPVPKNKSSTPVIGLKPGIAVVNAKIKGLSTTGVSGIKFESLLDPTAGNYPSIPPLLSTIVPTAFSSPLNLTAPVVREGGGGGGGGGGGSRSGGDDSSREWKRYKLYDREDLHAAIEEVRQGRSAAAAAKKFGIPSRTLYAKIKKLGIPTAPRKAYGRMVLNAQQYQKVSGSAAAAAAALRPQDQQNQQHSQLAAATFMQQIMRPLNATSIRANRKGVDAQHGEDDSFYDDLRRAYLDEEEMEEGSMDSSAANSRAMEDDDDVNIKQEDDDDMGDDGDDGDDVGNVASVVVEAELGTGDEDEDEDDEDGTGGDGSVAASISERDEDSTRGDGE